MHLSIEKTFFSCLEYCPCPYINRHTYNHNKSRQVTDPHNHGSKSIFWCIPFTSMRACACNIVFYADGDLQDLMGTRIKLFSHNSSISLVCSSCNVTRNNRDTSLFFLDPQDWPSRMANPGALRVPNDKDLWICLLCVIVLVLIQTQIQQCYIPALRAFTVNTQ